MRSIIDITWGTPHLKNGMVIVPFGMNICDDVTPGAEINEVGFEPTSFFFQPATIARGQKSIEDCIHSIVEDQRNHYAAISIEKLRREAIDFVRKCDLTPLVHPLWAKAGIPQPTNH